MNTKRFLALALGLLMLLPLALTAFAYTTPYTDRQVASIATPGLTATGSNTSFYYNGSTTATNPGSNTIGATCSGGAMTFNKSEAANWRTATKNVPTIIGTAGSTFDLYAKFTSLPTVNKSAFMTNDGAVTANFHHGLVFDYTSASVLLGTGKCTEAFFTFVKYNNTKYGTNAALVICTGNRSSMGTSAATPYTYFFNTDSQYHRYTLTFDISAKKVDFYIDGAKTALLNGTGAYGTVSNTYGGLMYRTAATSNWLYVDVKYNTSASSTTTAAKVSIDQMDIYANPMAPLAGGGPASFEGDPIPAVENAQMQKARAIYNDLAPYATDYINPTFWNAFKGWIDYCYDLVETGGEQTALDAACTGTSGNWFINRLTWLSTAGATATTGGSAVTVSGTGTVIPAATPIITGTDRIWISHSSYNGRSDAYGHHNAAILLTQPGMYMSEYAAYDQIYDMALSPSWRAYVCGPTKVAGVYQLLEMGYNKDACVPEGGFILAVNVDGVSNGSVATSGYASVLFGDRNERAISAAGFAVGDLVKLSGVTIHADKAATLDTTGTWYCAGDPRITTKTPITRPDAVSAGEYFNGFKTNAYMIEVDASDVAIGGTVKTSVEGSGSVTAKVGSSTVNASSFNVASGSTVTLTASGTNFLYWKNAKNGATISTESVFEFTYGGTDMELIAVFAGTGSSTTNYTVTFKDGLTGKILGTTTVAAGSTVPAAAVPSVTAVYGYVFKGWYANVNQGDVSSYTINGNTTFYARYKSDEAAFFNLTVTDGSKSETMRVRYAKIAVVTASASNFTNWTLDGTFYSSAKTVQVSMPNRDCTLQAVNSGAKTFDPSIRFIANFVDDSGALLTTFVRDIPATSGLTVVESGILMTRKASADDLVVDTIIASVTKGVSTVGATENVFGFVKKDITSKAGTWYVRGYLNCTNSDGLVYTYYTGVETIEVEGTGAVERKTTFVAMSHNMRNGNTSYSAIASNAAAEGADIVGVQEAGTFYYNSLENAMENAGYSAIQGSSRGGGFNSEYNPIFYKLSRFLLHNSGTFWLSDTPNTESKYSGLKYYRICTWAVFEDRQTGEYIQYFNTHLCATASTEGASDTAAHELNRFKQAKALLTQVEYISQNCPSGHRNVLIGGDFNMTETHGVLKYLTGSATYKGETNTITGSRFRRSYDIADVTTANSQGNFYTMHESGVPKYTFDHIFADIGGIQVNEFKVVSNAANSDHQPILVKCTLK